MLNANDKVTCARAEALVTYLYGELPVAEVADFRAHAAQCPQCSVDLVEFEGVHRSMVDWREVTLDQMAQPVISPELWQPAAAAAPVPAPRPNSWLAELREFFAASPRWAQAGIAAAALVVMAITVAYLVHYRTPSSFAVARTYSLEPVPANTLTSPKQTNEVKGSEQLASTGNSTPRRRTNSTPSSGSQVAVKKIKQQPSRDAGRSQELASLTKDLLLLDAGERESGAPRLSDILTDGDVPTVEPNH
jgi:hypothetical protein